MEVVYRTAGELAHLVRSRALSAREVVAAHLDQVERANPPVNAIVTLTAERALAQARAADERLAGGAEVGPLHGIVVVHKDTHDTEGVRTTYGSPVFADHVPDRDELVVARLRAAGAISIGKSNVPEFGAGSHTFNPVFGATRNPYAPDRSAGGSSGGAAAALAAGMCALAEGSDMGGSLRNPASFCNVVGFRPSPGRVPSWPSRAPWSTMTVQGPLARTVADAALLLSVLAGPDPRSPIALEAPGAPFAEPLDPDLSGLRVAWTPDLGGMIPVDPEVAAVLAATPTVLTGLGCRVEPDSPDLSGADEVFRTLRAWQFELTHGELLDRHPHLLKPTLRDNIAAGRRLTGPEVGRAHVLHAALHERVCEFFTRYDVLVLPVSQVAPFPVELEYPTEIAGQPMSDYLEWMRSAYLISVTGCPALSVPAGFTPAGLPVGLQIVTAPRADRLALRVGHAVEVATGFGRRRPETSRSRS
ncbi:MAG TPA: amidase [Actinophytocola sp.]|uniref:amidase n=1 Tax=Actinophytocola sp. TaxID=1872138 RepID=UPI002DB87749|nr:amidase [Actinophytocola sp.]HEU5474270.1 amidase [Actinophytocola sp.]